MKIIKVLLASSGAILILLGLPMENLAMLFIGALLFVAVIVLVCVDKSETTKK